MAGCEPLGARIDAVADAKASCELQDAATADAKASCNLPEASASDVQVDSVPQDRPLSHANLARHQRVWPRMYPLGTEFVERASQELAERAEQRRARHLAEGEAIVREPR
jgi:hypothetical protein